MISKIITIFFRIIDRLKGEILHIHFRNLPTGVFTTEGLSTCVNGKTTWGVEGLGTDRTNIVNKNGKRLLRVTYPSQHTSNEHDRVKFNVYLGKNYDELYLSYSVRFSDNFDFMQGGYLPGLSGGSCPKGFSLCKSGFSALSLWKTSGAITQNRFYPDKPKPIDDNLYYTNASGNQYFTPGEWHVVEHRIKLNTDGNNDGLIQAWVDGIMVLDIGSLHLRMKSYNFSIDTLYFLTHHGDDKNIWHPIQDQFADFGDIIVSKNPISH